MLTRQILEQELAKLQQENAKMQQLFDQMQANLNAIGGAIQFVEQLLNKIPVEKQDINTVQ